jgi:hypothetical protein
MMAKKLRPEDKPIGYNDLKKCIDRVLGVSK